MVENDTFALMRLSQTVDARRSGGRKAATPHRPDGWLHVRQLVTDAADGLMRLGHLTPQLGDVRLQGRHARPEVFAGAHLPVVYDQRA